MGNVSLKPITIENWQVCIGLTVEEEQVGLLPSNLYSIAESRFESEVVPMGIHDGETMVGFLMFGMIGDEMWIWRLMVDHRYQHQGYGRAAMRALLEGLHAFGYREIFVSYKPENEIAAQLYASLGFEDTGRVEDGEIVVCLGGGRTDALQVDPI